MRTKFGARPRSRNRVLYSRGFSSGPSRCKDATHRSRHVYGHYTHLIQQIVVLCVGVCVHHLQPLLELRVFLVFLNGVLNGYQWAVFLLFSAILTVFGGIFIIFGHFADFEKLPLQFLQCKDHSMSSVDRAVAWMLT